MKEISLPSGAILNIGDVPFEASNNLKKVVMKEFKGIEINSAQQLIELCKDYICTVFSSESVEACLWECMKRCTYNNLKIDKNTFESIEARQDFTDVQWEVGQECLLPFGKSLLVVLQRVLALAGGAITPESK